MEKKDHTDRLPQLLIMKKYNLLEITYGIDARGYRKALKGTMTCKTTPSLKESIELKTIALQELNKILFPSENEVVESVISAIETMSPESFRINYKHSGSTDIKSPSYIRGSDTNRVLAVLKWPMDEDGAF